MDKANGNLFIKTTKENCIHDEECETIVLLTNPPKIKWTCPKCFFTGYKIIK